MNIIIFLSTIFAYLYVTGFHYSKNSKPNKTKKKTKGIRSKYKMSYLLTQYNVIMNNNEFTNSMKRQAMLRLYNDNINVSSSVELEIIEGTLCELTSLIDQEDD